MRVHRLPGVRRSLFVASVAIFGAACGSADDTLFRGSGATGGTAGIGGSASGGASGGGASSGGSAGAVGGSGDGSCETSAQCVSPWICDEGLRRCVAPAPSTGGTTGTDGGPPQDGSFGGGGFEAGGAFGSGGTPAAGGSGGTAGWPGVPEGAWARCEQDSDCLDGRVCTKTIQGGIASGRSGGCVKPCTIGGASNCDPGPPGGGVVCANFIVGFCSLTCQNGGCPEGLDCIAGFCFWEN